MFNVRITYDSSVINIISRQRILSPLNCGTLFIIYRAKNGPTIYLAHNFIFIGSIKFKNLLYNLLNLYQFHPFLGSITGHWSSVRPGMSFPRFQRRLHLPFSSANALFPSAISPCPSGSAHWYSISAVRDYGFVIRRPVGNRIFFFLQISANPSGHRDPVVSLSAKRL